MAEFGLLNSAILIAYFAAMLGIGFYFSRGQRTTDDYLLAGRNMSWFPIAISVMATAQSAISYIGIPAWTYARDMTMFVWSSSILFTVPILNWLFLPLLYRRDAFTAYEYLEKRFSPKVRSVTSLIFLLSQGLYLGVVIYAHALVLSMISGLSLDLCIIGMAVVTILYTVMGGIQAVIWTDVLQFGVMFGGVVLSIVIILAHIPGGWLGFWRIAQEHHKLRVFNFATDLTTPFTFWGALAGGMFTQLAQFGTNQIIVQRYFTAKSLQEGKRAIWFQGAFFTPYLLLCFVIGPLLFVFYRTHPHLTPSADPDNIFPYFIVSQMPVGISGLVIAAIFAAAMSTYSSAINSLSTVTVHDFYRRYVRPKGDAASEMRIARITTILWGVYSGLFALGCQYLGPLVTIDLKVLGPLSGILLGIFLLGMLTQTATSVGILTGMLMGSIGTYATIFGTELSFMWYTPLGCLLTFACGWVVSRMNRPRIINKASR